MNIYWRLGMKSFIANRKKLGLSQSQLATSLNTAIYTVRKLESNQWKELPMEIVLNACKKLDLDIPSLLKNHFNIDLYPDENGTDEFEYLITTHAISRMQMFLHHIDEFCKLAKIRKNDYDWIKIGISLKDINELSILVYKLKEKQISRKEALEILPPHYPRSKRRD